MPLIPFPDRDSQFDKLSFPTTLQILNSSGPSIMSARQELLKTLPNQPEKVAGLVLMYLHSLPGYVAPEKSAEAPAVDYWEIYWSKVYGSCEGMEWDEPKEQEFEVREEW